MLRITEIKERICEISEFIEIAQECMEHAANDEKNICTRQLDDYKTERRELLLELENLTSKPAYYSLDQLNGIFNQPEDEGHFLLDIQIARDEILNKFPSDHN